MSQDGLQCKLQVYYDFPYQFGQQIAGGSDDLWRHLQDYSGTVPSSRMEGDVMQHQNKDQAEQLIAEVLAAACLVIENDARSAKDQSLARRLLSGAQDALHSRQISVLSQAGGRESELLASEVKHPDARKNRKIVMRRRGRLVVLDLTRLTSFGSLMTMEAWCKSALSRNLSRAFKILGHPEYR